MVRSVTPTFAASSPIRYAEVAGAAVAMFASLRQLATAGERPAVATRAGPDPARKGRLLGHSLAQARRDVVECLSIGGGAVMRRELDPEPIALPPRDHVQMRMKDFLPRRGAVREEEIDGLAAQAGSPQAGGDAPRERPHRDGRDLVDLRDRGGVLPGHDEGVTLVDRMQVEERDRVAPLSHEARLLLALDDPAKDAGRALTHVASSFMAFASACAPRAA